MGLLARVTYRLPTPIVTAAPFHEALPVVVAYTGVDSCELSAVHAVNERGENTISAFDAVLRLTDAACHCSPHACAPAPDGATHMIRGDWLAHLAVATVVKAVVRETFQVAALRNCEFDSRHVLSYEWEQNGRTLPKRRTNESSATYYLPDPFDAETPLSAQAWAALSGLSTEPENETSSISWRSLLVQAYDAYLARDLAGTVLRTATCLDVGAGRYYREGRPFFHPERLSEALFGFGQEPWLADLKQLWYTRHGVIHRGRLMLYDGQPYETEPLRRLEHADAKRFLQAVASAMLAIEASGVHPFQER